MNGSSKRSQPHPLISEYFSVRSAVIAVKQVDQTDSGGGGGGGGEVSDTVIGTSWRDLIAPVLKN